MSRRTLCLLALTGGLLASSALPSLAQNYASNASLDRDGYENFETDFAPPPRRGRAPRADVGYYAQDPSYADEDMFADPQPRARTNGRPRVASLPSDADAANSSAFNFDDQVNHAETTGQVVYDTTGAAPGTITVNTGERRLYVSLGGGRAIQYGIGVGREGFLWKGAAMVGRKAVWPGWTPPGDMLKRRPDLPRHMEGGLDNPLGARALYLFKGNKDTMFRIHGTNEPDTIGQAVSSGCIRMLNADVIDLYQRIGKGARVVVI